jgi:diaminopimelate epimerase
MLVSFEKVQGLGNDFVLVDARKHGSLMAADLARQLCDRHLGIGADGVLTLLPSRGDSAARLHVFNADGTVAEMCGNGLRCAARLLLEEGGSDAVRIETDAGVLRCEARPGPGDRCATIRAEAGRPTVSPAEKLRVGRRAIRGFPVALGNPHFVIFEGTDESEWGQLGPAVERHPRFAPGKTNVEFARPTRDGLELRVWERGAGFTLACGTGACATVAAACSAGFAKPAQEVAVHLPGGTLWVELAPDGSQVFMRGPAERVFAGSFAPDRYMRSVADSVKKSPLRE